MTINVAEKQISLQNCMAALCRVCVVDEMEVMVTSLMLHYIEMGMFSLTINISL